MCFSIVNLIHKITNKKDNDDVFAILIHCGIITTISHTFKDKKIVYPIQNTIEIILTVCIELI